MRKEKTEWRESSWLTVRQLADALDVSTDYARREVLRCAPNDMIRRDGRRIMVYGRGAIECWLAERVEKSTPAVPLIGENVTADIELAERLNKRLLALCSPLR